MTHAELHERQGWTLQQKIDHSLEVIETFVSRMGGLDKVYCSFSGGKDSTVLLDLCRIVYPDIKAVFFNTGNEYPDIVHFVKKLIGGGVQHRYSAPQIYAQTSVGAVWISSYKQGAEFGPSSNQDDSKRQIA